jgi:type I restriction enzyme S subunit
MANVSSSNGLEKYPKLRFKDFSEPWKTDTLGNLGTFMKGAPLSKADITDEGTPFVLYGELYTTYGEVTRSIKRRTDKVVEPQFYSKVGDVIMPTSGETPEDIATASCIMLPDVILAGDLLIYRTQKVDGRLVSFVVKNKVNKQISSVAQGKSVVHVRAEELSKISISYPSDAEQQKILTMLELLEYKMAKQRELIEHLKKYKRGVSIAIFDRKISLTKNNPSWIKTTVGEICKITMGQSPDSESYNTDQIGIPLVQGNADMRNRITCPQRYTSKPTKICEKGSIILSVRAPVGSVGRADRTVCLGRGVCAINSDNNDFLYYFFERNEPYWKRIEQGGTFTAISGDDIADMPIDYPSLEERQKIADFLLKIDTHIAVEENTLNQLVALKSGLLQQLFI